MQDLRGSLRLGPVAGVVLAAGSSTRLGRNKLLVDLGGEAMVRRTVRRALAAGLEPVVVVVGHEAGRVSAEVADLRCSTVVNPDHAGGQASSLKAGLDALPEAVAAAVVVLADMPLVTADMLAALIDRYREGTARLVASDFGGVTAPPTLYDRSLFSDLSRMDGGGLAARLAARHPDATVAVAWPAAALADIDDEGDLARVRERVAAEEASPIGPRPAAPEA